MYQKILLSSVFITLISFKAIAVEGNKTGHSDYKLACMSCHGEEGKGDGPYAKKLKQVPTDLTQITKSHGGKFPFEKISKIIDGREVISAHSREMPIWGKHFQVSVDANESQEDLEKRAKLRIEELVKYIETIQQP